MSGKTLSRDALLAIVGVCLLLAFALSSASASTIDWTTWSSNTSGTMTALGINVTYAGQMNGLSMNYPSWNPASTFSGGTVGNPPPSSGGMIRLTGGNPNVNTITFSSPVVDPVMAIWSLGQGGIAASFTFTPSEPFTIESGGPSAEFAGTSIIVCPGNSSAVCGSEGNGTIQFHGTFSSLTWTNPVFENYYGFTVGATGAAPPTVPEPGTLLMLGSACAGLATFRKRIFQGR